MPVPARAAGQRVGLVVLALLVLAGLIGPWLIPHDPYTQDLLARLQEPVWAEGGDWKDRKSVV